MGFLSLITAAITSVSDSFRTVFTWKTGGRTKDENTLRSDAEHAHANYQEALASGDVDRINAARAELRRVQSEARSKS